MAESEDYLEAAKVVRQAAKQLSIVCDAMMSLGLVGESTLAREHEALRQTRGGGGRQRAEILKKVVAEGARLYSESADLLDGVADVLDAAARNDRKANVSAASVLIRSALERAGVASWFISDLDFADSLVPEFEIDEARLRGQTWYWNWIVQSSHGVSGTDSCRRLLIWFFEQLRYDRNTLRQVSLEPESADPIFAFLDVRETELIGSVKLAGWQARPEQLVDGSWTASALLREIGGKPERMPPLSDLASATSIEYAELSSHAHPSHSMVLGGSGRDSDLDYLLGLVKDVLVAGITLFAWSGIPFDKQKSQIFDQFLSTCTRVLHATPTGRAAWERVVAEKSQVTDR